MGLFERLKMYTKGRATWDAKMSEPLHIRIISTPTDAESAKSELVLVQKVLEKYKIPKHMYSLGKEAEEKVNLFWEDGRWLVTNVERGHRQFFAEYGDIDAAAYDLFSELTASVIKLRCMRQCYNRLKERR